MYIKYIVLIVFMLFKKSFYVIKIDYMFMINHYINIYLWISIIQLETSSSLLKEKCVELNILKLINLQFGLLSSYVS